MTEEKAVLCHCGKPLHYLNKEIQEAIQGFIEAKGENMRVTAGGRTWIVPRHYIALHGIKAVDLPNLGFEEVLKPTVEDNDATEFEYQRDLPDGRSVWVLERYPGNVIIIIGPTGAVFYDSHWCYNTVKGAVDAAIAWDPAIQEEPEGWYRHAMTGRRRPDGDKSKEYIHF